jgi:RNA polymerase sigma-70 factor (ECF subfamily)
MPSTTAKPSSSTTPSSQSYDLQALQAREQWAVQEWIVSQQPFLRRVLVHHGADPDDLPELVQEVLCRAIEALPDFRGNAKITTWLYSIARNVAYSRARKRTRRTAMGPEDLAQTSAKHRTRAESTGERDPWDDPWTVAVSREKSALIERALDELPDHYAEVIRLRDLDEQSTAEAASAIGISRVNTRVRLHRARKALREVLQPYFENANGEV